MSELQHVPFGLGETLSGKDADGNLINKHWLGMIAEFPVAASTANDNRGNKARLVGKTIRAVVLRNESGQTLYGGKVARLTATAGYSLITSVDGYMAGGVAVANPIVIDDRLATNGVADDDLFWGVFSGPQALSTAIGTGSGDHERAIAVGDSLVNATGTTITATTSGRVTLPIFTAATAGNTSNGYDAFRFSNNLIGVALSAATTAQTNTAILVDTRIRFR